MYAKHPGNTSFTLTTEFRVAGEARPIVTAETVYVSVDAQTLRKTPLPADLRAALERLAPGAVTDHAGYLAGLVVSVHFSHVTRRWARALAPHSCVPCRD